jgi:hypothetical protein
MQFIFTQYKYFLNNLLKHKARHKNIPIPDFKAEIFTYISCMIQIIIYIYYRTDILP